MKDLNIIKLDQKRIDEIKENDYQTIMRNNECKMFIDLNQISSNVVRQNTATFILFINSQKLCKECKSESKCTQKIGFHVLDLSYDPEFKLIDVIFKKCHKKLIKERLYKSFIASDFKPEWRNYTMNERDMKFCVRERMPVFANLQKVKTSKKGVYLYGPKKVGKSFLLSQYFAEIAKESKDVKIGFFNSVDLFKNLNEYYFHEKEKYQELYDSILTVDYLILDDFGNEYKSDFIRDNFIYPLISRRVDRNLPIFYTSNYDLDEIKEMFSTSRAAAPRAKQLLELISSQCEVVELDSIPYE